METQSTQLITEDDILTTDSDYQSEIIDQKLAVWGRLLNQRTGLYAELKSSSPESHTHKTPKHSYNWKIRALRYSYSYISSCVECALLFIL